MIYHSERPKKPGLAATTNHNHTYYQDRIHVDESEPALIVDFGFDDTL